jgi:hypothetical protein
LGTRPQALTGRAGLWAGLDRNVRYGLILVALVAFGVILPLVPLLPGVLIVSIEIAVVGAGIVVGALAFELQPLRRPLTPMTLFLLFFALFFLVEPIDSLLLGHHILDVFNVSATDGFTVGEAIALSTASLVAVFAGYWAILRLVPAPPVQAVNPLPPVWSDRPVNVIVAALFLVNTVAVLLFIRAAGGVQSYFHGLSLGLTMVQGPLQHYFPFVAIYGSIAFIAYVVHGRRPVLVTITLGALTVALLQFDPNLTRQNILGIAIALLVVYLVLRTRGEDFDRRDWQIAGGLAAVLLVYSVGHELYRELNGVNYVTPSSIKGYVHQLFEPFRPTQDYVALTTMFPNLFDYDYGRHFLDLFTFAVPRSFWPDKPPYFGYEWVSYGPLQTRNYETSFTYMGELYAAGGPAAVALGSVALGAAVGLLERLSRLARADRYVLLVYALLLAIWIPNVVRAGLFDSTLNFLAYLPPLIVLGLVVADPGRRRTFAKYLLVAGAAYASCAALILATEVL